MRRYLILIAALLLLGVSSKSVLAEPPCEPGKPCPRIFTIAPIMALDPAVPFAWLRSAPNSSASTVYTITAGGRFYLHPEKYYQTGTDEAWIEVSLVPNGKIRGWVEKKSLTDTPTIALPGQSILPTDPQTFKQIDQILLAKWVSSPYAGAGRLARGVKYAWLRRLPGTMDILTTIFPSSTFVLLNVSPPYFDGQQWWAPVQFASTEGLKSGWIELSSIVVTYKSKASFTAVACDSNGVCTSV